MKVPSNPKHSEILWNISVQQVEKGSRKVESYLTFGFQCYLRTDLTLTSFAVTSLLLRTDKRAHLAPKLYIHAPALPPFHFIQEKLENTRRCISIAAPRRTLRCAAVTRKEPTMCLTRGAGFQPLTSAALLVTIGISPHLSAHPERDVGEE